MKSGDVTDLLPDWQNGRQEALDELMPLVYDQLRVIAARHLVREPSSNSLRATELVHGAYLKLAGADASPTDRAHFYALASRIIRHILTNHGKAKRRDKRGGGAVRLPLDEAALIGADQQDALLDIHEALERLEAFDARKGRVVELIFFGGLEQDLAAQVLEISRRLCGASYAWQKRGSTTTCTETPEWPRHESWRLGKDSRPRRRRAGYGSLRARPISGRGMRRGCGDPAAGGSAHRGSR